MRAVAGLGFRQHPLNRCWEDLAQAIILSAVKDYRTALRNLRIAPESKHWRKKKREMERFFRSWWFGILTDVDPNGLMDGLQKEAKI